MKQDVKILIRHFIAYGVGIYLSKLVGFFMIPIYTKYLTPADYGALELLDLTMYLFAMFVGLGVANSIIRFYSDCNTEQEKTQVISTAITYLTALSLICGVVMVALARPVSFLMFSSGSESSYSREELTYFLRIITCSQILELISTAGIACLQAEKKSTLFTIASVGKFVLAVSLNIVFVVGMQLGVKGVLYSGLIANCAFLPTILIMVRRRLAWRVSPPLATEMLKFGSPLIAATLSMYIIHFASRFFLERFVGLSVLGIYSLGYKFAMVLPALFYSPFEMIWNTQMFDLYKKGEDGRRTIDYYHKYILVLSLLFIVGYSLAVKDLILIMADPKFYAAHEVVPPLLVAFTFIGLASISSAGLFFVKKTLYRGLANIYAAIVALVCYYFLIKAFGYWGAVIATFVAFVVRYVALSLYSQRFYPLTYNVILYLKLVPTTAVPYLAASLIRIDNHVISLVARSAVGVILFIVLAIILRVFNRYEIDAAKSLMMNVWKTRIKRA